MNILNVEKVSKGFGNRTLLDEVTLGINEGDKIGVIGVNGTGKSTLLKIIAGIEEPDDGKVVMGRNIKTAYLPQTPEFEKDDTVISYVCGGKEYVEGYQTVESEAAAILTRLGITDMNEPVKHLSGGQQKRIALAKMLINPADIIVLDEPTNHLDSEMVIWLEDFLQRFRGQVVMVTHDRYFLDRVTNRIIEIDREKLYSYNTNYSGFLELKTQREEMALATERKRQSILRTELEWIRRGCQARSTKQQARVDRFYDMKEASRLARQSFINSNVEMSSIASRIGKKTIEIKNISKSYGNKQLIKDFSHIVLRDERLGIIGPNGCGKSTLVKIISGEVEPDTGSVEIGETIKIGYFMQDNRLGDENINVIQYVKNIGEYVATVDGRITASQMCEKFLFSPQKQYTPICKLSGGEKRRLYLLSVLMESPNVLILDEPTNDLDIETLSILENYLDNFPGMIITVSHDRYFLDRVADRIFAFEGNGVIKQYEGGFTDYLDKKAEMEEGVSSIYNVKILQKDKTEENQEKYNKPRQSKLKFSYNEQREYDTIDDVIAGIEANIAKLDEEIGKCSSQYSKLLELTKEKEEQQKLLEEKMERWVYLNDLAEKIAAQE